MGTEAKKQGSAKTKVQMVAVAIAEDKALAKDYLNLLIANLLNAEMEKHSQNYDGSFSFALMVPQEDVDRAVEIIQSRSPSEYFYDSLFNPDKNLNENEEL